MLKIKIKTFLNFFRLFTRGLIEHFLDGNKKLYYLFFPIYLFFHFPLFLGLILAFTSSYYHLIYAIFWLYLWFFCPYMKVSDLRIVAFLTIKISKFFNKVKTDAKDFISKQAGDQDNS